MGHPKIENLTPFHFEPLFTSDEEMRPLFIGVIKATFRIQPEHYGPVIPMRDQPPLEIAGKFHGEPDLSSYMYEPECSPPKPATDVVLVGTARAPQENLTQFDTGFRVGTLVKVARVFGNRVWYRKLSGMAISQAEVITELPLIYEHAFGGVDKQFETENGFAMDPKNPLGKGYHHEKGNPQEGAPLPNIEDPNQLIHNYFDAPAPVGFGFIHPNWHPRVGYAGTYDESWQKHRSPMLPEDFDSRFYNSASPGLTALGYLNGDEAVHVLNASAWPKLSFKLPGLTSPNLAIHLKNRAVTPLSTQLDTVIIDTNTMLLHQFYRCRCSLRTGPHDVVSIIIYMDAVPEANLKSVK
jgi:hypothetical protein